MSSAPTHYDYIFTGAGASALMLAYRMAISGEFRDRKILLIDRDAKKVNDRTWCFWEEGESEWDAIISKQWDNCAFKSEWFSDSFKLNPFSYKMIRGLDFYQFVFKELGLHPNISFINDEVAGVKDHGNFVEVKTSNNNYQGVKVFNSIFDPGELKSQSKYPVLQQHFIGWFVKTDKAVFNTDEATFMDFTVAQKGNTRFMYVLPTANNEALVEYTLFSQQLLPKAEYESEIKQYLANLGVANYKITETEKGSIPMSSYDFTIKNSRNLLHIGTAGGWTKASTGFTFSKINKMTKKLVKTVKIQSDFAKNESKTRFWYYDLLLLDVLNKHNGYGAKIFASLFERNSPKQIFKFLDEQTSLSQELKIMFSLPPKHFVTALLNRVF